MSTELIPSNYKLPDPKSQVGRILRLALAGGAIYLLYINMDRLIKFAEDITKLGIMLAVAMVVGYCLIHFRRKIKMVIDGLGEIAFGKLIKMNPYVVLRMQLDDDVKNLEKVQENTAIIEGVASKIKDKLDAKNQEMIQADGEVKTAKRTLLAPNPPPQAKYALQSALTDFANAQAYIKTVNKTYEDLKKLIAFADNAYMKASYALRDYRSTVETAIDTEEAVSAGARGMKSLLRAFQGDSEMNKAGDMALNELRNRIAIGAGTIRSTIKITSRIMSESDLKDASKVEMALDEASKLNIDANFNYLDIVSSKGNITEDTAASASQEGNAYMNFDKFLK